MNSRTCFIDKKKSRTFPGLPEVAGLVDTMNNLKRRNGRHFQFTYPTYEILLSKTNSNISTLVTIPTLCALNKIKCAIISLYANSRLMFNLQSGEMGIVYCCRSGY